MKHVLINRWRGGVNLSLLTVFALAAVLGISQRVAADGSDHLLSLDDAYELAMEANKQIGIARIEVDKSRLLPDKAQTTLFPRVNIRGGFTKLDQAITFEAQAGAITLPPIQTIPEEQWLGNFSFVQPLYDGRYVPLRRKAQYTQGSTTEAYFETAQTILFNIAQAYYEILKLKALIRNVEETIQMGEEEVRVSAVKFRAGAVTEDAVLRSELNLTRAKSQRIEYTNNLVLTESTLKQLLGDEIPQFETLEPVVIIFKVEDKHYDAFLDRAFANRHDFKRASLQVAIAESDIELVKSRFQPRLEATWDFYRTDNPSFYQRDSFWAGALKVEVPLLEGGLRFLDLKEKKDSYQQARLALQSAESAVRMDIKDAMLRVQTNEHVLGHLIKEVELAEKNHEIVFSQYTGGRASSLDVNTALASLQLSRARRIIKHYERQLDILSLDRALGVFGQDVIALPQPETQGQ